MALFVQKGFERVTVAEVADAVGVSEKTVFNYFPTKEDLFFDELPKREAALIDAVRSRADGESVVATLHRLQARDCTRLASPQFTVFARIIEESPALQAKEIEVMARFTQVLADVIAAELGARPVDAKIAANTWSPEQATVKQTKPNTINSRCWKAGHRLPGDRKGTTISAKSATRKRERRNGRRVPMRCCRNCGCKTVVAFSRPPVNSIRKQHIAKFRPLKSLRSISGFLANHSQRSGRQTTHKGNRKDHDEVRAEPVVLFALVQHNLQRGHRDHQQRNPHSPA